MWVTGLSILAAMSTVLGGWTALSALQSRTKASYMAALSAGLLLGVTFFTAMPQAARAPHGMAFVAAGFLGLLATQHLLTRNPARGSVSAAAVLAAMIAHSVVEGMVAGIAGSAGNGWMSLPALFLHKLPEGFSLAAVMLVAGHTRRRILLASAGVGAAMLTGMLAASLGLRLWPASAGGLMGVTAGCLLYIGSAEMLPGVSRKGWLHIWLVALGITAVHAATLLG